MVVVYKFLSISKAFKKQLALDQLRESKKMAKEQALLNDPTYIDKNKLSPDDSQKQTPTDNQENKEEIEASKDNLNKSDLNKTSDGMIQRWLNKWLH